MWRDFLKNYPTLTLKKPFKLYVLKGFLTLYTEGSYFFDF